MLDCTFSPTRWEFHSRFTLIIRIQRVSSTTVRCGSSHHFRHRGCQTVVLFQFVRLDAMVHVYGASYQSLNPLGVPAAPAGLSSRATEPTVSALRVSIPDACTLARAGDCKLPTPLCKTPWRRAPVLLWAWITCISRRSNRRHACGDTAHEARAGCHRHGCAVATVGEAGLIKARVKGGFVALRAFFVLPCCAALRKSASLLSCYALNANPPTAGKQAHGHCVLRTAFVCVLMRFAQFLTACLQGAEAVLGR